MKILLLPHKMEIRLVDTEDNVCKDTKNHELQNYVVVIFPPRGLEIVSKYFSF